MKSPRKLSTKWKNKRKNVPIFQPRRKKGQPTPVLLPGKLRGQRSLVGYCLWGHKELDMTE